MNLVDRRANPTGKSLPNRQRFLARAKHQIQNAITEALKRRKLGESGTGEKIAIPTRIITEPTFRAALRSGKRSHVMSGNRAFVPGDRIERPKGGGAAGRGSTGSEDDDAKDSFEFELSKEEFLKLFFDELALPDLVKRTLNEQMDAEGGQCAAPVHSQTKISLSVLRNLMRPGTDGCRTSSCCRRKRISASRATLDLRNDKSSAPRSFRTSIIRRRD
jgi:uncharacterized sporulation protein YeaH/YhbH (DUF444 family)